MDSFTFEMDDFSIDFACDEDFGLAKSFTTTPMFQVAPLKNFSNTGVDDVEKDVNAHNLSEVKAEGFCFRMHPAEDQIQFQR